MPAPISRDGLFGAVGIAASAMGAERLRMTTASENLAHAGDTRRGADGLPYARQRVLFRTMLDAQGRDTGRVDAQVTPSPRYERRYDPEHPDADAQGVVTTPAIDPILELTDLLIAGKAYEANANAARGLMRMHENALRIGLDG
jgi:flagellar basal-body rod protein FlgC